MSDRIRAPVRSLDSLRTQAAVLWLGFLELGGSGCRERGEGGWRPRSSWDSLVDGLACCVGGEKPQLEVALSFSCCV